MMRLTEDFSPSKLCCNLLFLSLLCISLSLFPLSLPPFHLRCNAHCHYASASTKLLPFPWRPTSQRVPKWYGLMSVCMCLCACVCVSVVCHRKTIIIILLEEQSDSAESAFSKQSGPAQASAPLSFFMKTHTYPHPWLHTHKRTLSSSWCSKASCRCFESRPTDVTSINQPLFSRPSLPSFFADISCFSFCLSLLSYFFIFPPSSFKNIRILISFRFILLILWGLFYFIQ